MLQEGCKSHLSTRSILQGYGEHSRRAALCQDILAGGLESVSAPIKGHEVSVS